MISGSQYIMQDGGGSNWGSDWGGGSDWGNVSDWGGSGSFGNDSFGGDTSAYGVPSEILSSAPTSGSAPIVESQIAPVTNLYGISPDLLGSTYSPDVGTQPQTAAPIDSSLTGPGAAEAYARQDAELPKAGTSAYSALGNSAYEAVKGTFGSEVAAIMAENLVKQGPLGWATAVATIASGNPLAIASLGANLTGNTTASGVTSILGGVLSGTPGGLASAFGTLLGDSTVSKMGAGVNFAANPTLAGGFSTAGSILENKDLSTIGSAIGLGQNLASSNPSYLTDINAARGLINAAPTFGDSLSRDTSKLGDNVSSLFGSSDNFGDTTAQDYSFFDANPMGDTSSIDTTNSEDYTKAADEALKTSDNYYTKDADTQAMIDYENNQDVVNAGDVIEITGHKPKSDPTDTAPAEDAAQQVVITGPKPRSSENGTSIPIESADYVEPAEDAAQQVVITGPKPKPTPAVPTPAVPTPAGPTPAGPTPAVTTPAVTTPKPYDINPLLNLISSMGGGQQTSYSQTLSNMPKFDVESNFSPHLAAMRSANQRGKMSPEQQQYADLMQQTGYRG